VTNDFRPLTPREREILDYLLSVETPGVSELRQQAEVVLARPWTCGCASIDLAVDRTGARSSPITGRPAIEAQSKEREDPKGILDLLLWVEDGWLSGIELVAYGFERHEDANVFPPPADFGPPGIRCAGAA
jgi:hypothetical protein